MPNFHRYYLSDGLVFITCVTYQRIHYLEGQRNLHLFWEVLNRVKKTSPFNLLAYVILPDHFHWIMQTTGEANFSSVMREIKRQYTDRYKNNMGSPILIHLWQARFWDHLIRDEQDFENHMDYIHWNPVKHGYVCAPELWPESTFMDWAERGCYGAGWGGGSEPPAIQGMNPE